MISFADEHSFIQNEEDQIPTTISRKNFTLSKISKKEIPINESNYYETFDSFRSEYYARISDMPLCAQNYETHKCEKCEKEMKHILSITSELFDESPNFFQDYNLFLGDLVLCFWLCDFCKRIKTEMQPI